MLQLTHPETSLKLCKFCENLVRDAPVRGVSVPKFGKISVKFPVLGVLYYYLCTDVGEILHGVDLRRTPPSKFHPHRCNVSPL